MAIAPDHVVSTIYDLFVNDFEGFKLIGALGTVACSDGRIAVGFGAKSGSEADQVALACRREKRSP